MTAIAIAIHFTTQFLMLLGVCFLTGESPTRFRLLLGAAVGSLHASLCLIPGMGWLGIWWLRFGFLLSVAAVAFGVRRQTIRCWVLLALLHTAVENLAMGIFSGTMLGALAAGAAVVVLCAVALWGGRKDRLVQVKIVLGERKLELTALRDTGHFLQDPITGESVLIAGADTAGYLLGLSNQQLRDPVATVESGAVPGARLIPCRTVGGSSLLLGVKCAQVWIDGRPAGRLVAFSPEQLGLSGEYQALTGGEV